MNSPIDVSELGIYVKYVPEWKRIGKGNRQYRLLKYRGLKENTRKERTPL